MAGIGAQPASNSEIIKKVKLGLVLKAIREESGKAKGMPPPELVMQTQLLSAMLKKAQVLFQLARWRISPPSIRPKTKPCLRLQLSDIPSQKHGQPVYRFLNPFSNPTKPNRRSQKRLMIGLRVNSLNTVLSFKPRPTPA